ncbi:MAG TPA: PIN domain-containing protein [Stellaceae bacterium]|nr:PIN domain-containing protein [Stellaceae bacterium]
MTLVDSSVWMDHLRKRDARLADLLTAGQVLIHPYIIGEIAMGNLRDRDRNLSDLSDLPPASVATDDEVLTLVSRHGLFGQGLGYVDAHLLASTRLTAGAVLWTRDKRLRAVAERLDLAMDR